MKISCGYATEYDITHIHLTPVFHCDLRFVLGLKNNNENTAVRLHMINFNK